MDKANVQVDENRSDQENSSRDGRATTPAEWETPRIEDVSQQVMAQPYIRFT